MKTVRVHVCINLPVTVEFDVEVDGDFNPNDPDPDLYKITHVQETHGAIVSSVRQVQEAMRDEDFEALDEAVAKAVKNASRK